MRQPCVRSQPFSAVRIHPAKKPTNPFQTDSAWAYYPATRLLPLATKANSEVQAVWRSIMTTEVVMLIIWGVVTVGFLALLAYNATLTRYEEDQLFLTAHSQANEDLQTSILKNVNRTRPMLRAFGGASALLGAVIVGMYTWEAWQRLHF
jgi:hypothetical protein